MNTQTINQKNTAMAVNKLGVLTIAKISEASRHRSDIVNAMCVVQVITGMNRTEIKETQLDLLRKWLEMHLGAPAELVAEYFENKQLQQTWLAEWLRRDVDFVPVFAAWHTAERMYVKRIADVDHLSEQQIDLIKFKAFGFWEDYHLTATFNRYSDSYKLFADKFKEVYHGKV